MWQTKKHKITESNLESIPQEIKENRQVSTKKHKITESNLESIPQEIKENRQVSIFSGILEEKPYFS